MKVINDIYEACLINNFTDSKTCNLRNISAKFLKFNMFEEGFLPVP
jgi:hypothetical protein